MALLWKMICNLEDHMSLRHPAAREVESTRLNNAYVTDTFNAHKRRITTPYLQTCSKASALSPCVTGGKKNTIHAPHHTQAAPSTMPAYAVMQCVYSVFPRPTRSCPLLPAEGCCVCRAGPLPVGCLRALGVYCRVET